MDNFVLIDGIAFWIILIFLIFQFIVLLLLGDGYIKSQRQIDLKNNQLKKLRSNYNKLIGMYQRDTSRVPEIANSPGDKNV